ncbi:MAG: hypothetical protein UV73_C0010G0006 [Candidatus Gottesmanbacteria bacterium GW2011_GWA2_43_14]|uniref:Uncharacterized protein n=1 Tax=Candidatus Gottesmanbacteria bacterium GW2011_GWA2_43_14 TaxID=1618443 RepID=A0A0G1FN41_9BACT|nr:MAG: hypothetical protein UV73_C0010G0006 [Candidatus Gottesmanbacteria bacterium GW2011_GWA2_43_14]
MKKYLIVTATDRKNGDFLINHWLPSLNNNVSLRGTDILILDYGLSAEQAAKLKKKKVILLSGNRHGNPVVMRFIDSGKFLLKNKYQQILSIDSGDVLFQGDILPLLKTDLTKFRIVKHDINPLYFEYYISKNFPKNLRKKLWTVLKDKPLYNAGVLLAPRKKYLLLCRLMEKMISNKNLYGSDQVIVNYLLHQNPVKLLDNRYNFMPHTDMKEFFIKNGQFRKNNGELIEIFHNAGKTDFMRPIKNFGVLTEGMKLDPKSFYLKKIFYSTVRVMKYFSDLLLTFKPGFVFQFRQQSPNDQQLSKPG